MQSWWRKLEEEASTSVYTGLLQSMSPGKVKRDHGGSLTGTMMKEAHSTKLRLLLLVPRHQRICSTKPAGLPLSSNVSYKVSKRGTASRWLGPLSFEDDFSDERQNARKSQ